MQVRHSHALPNTWIHVECYYSLILSEYWSAGPRIALHPAIILLWSDSKELVQLWLNTAMFTVMRLHDGGWVQN